MRLLTCLRSSAAAAGPRAFERHTACALLRDGGQRDHDRRRDGRRRGSSSERELLDGTTQARHPAHALPPRPHRRPRLPSRDRAVRADDDLGAREAAVRHPTKELLAASRSSRSTRCPSSSRTSRCGTWPAARSSSPACGSPPAGRTATPPRPSASASGTTLDVDHRHGVRPGVGAVRRGLRAAGARGVVHRARAPQSRHPLISRAGGRGRRATAGVERLVLIHLPPFERSLEPLLDEAQAAVPGAVGGDRRPARSPSSRV